jgi:hypothetical protein
MDDTYNILLLENETLILQDESSDTEFQEAVSTSETVAFADRSPDATSNHLEVVNEIQSQDPFGNKQTFKSRDEASITAMSFIYEKMKQEGGTREYGYEIEKDWQGNYVLGNLIKGDNDSVEANQSINGPLQQLGIRSSYQSGGHSHPYLKEVNSPHLSYADIQEIASSDANDGIHSETLLDYPTGQVYQIEIDDSISIPDAFAKKNPTHKESQSIQDWIKGQLCEGNLRVRLLADLDGKPSPASFKFYTDAESNESYPPLQVEDKRIRK